MAAAPTVVAAVLGNVLAEFRQDQPTIELNLRELVSPELICAVRDQSVDFGITPFVGAVPDLSFTPLVREPLVALVPAPLAKAIGPTLDVASLEDVPLILMESMPVITLAGTREMPGQLEDPLKARTPTLTVICRVRQAYSMVAMSAAGLGVSLVPRLALPESLPSSLAVVPLSGMPLVRDVGVVTLFGSALSPPAIRLVELLGAALHAHRVSSAATPNL